MNHNSNLCERKISKLFPRLQLVLSQVLNEYSCLRNDFLRDNKQALKSIQCQLKFIHKHTNFENLKIIYTILLIFPFSKVANESGFSHMNSIKTRFRNKLSPKNLENLLFLALYPPENINYESLAFAIDSQFKFT